MTSRSSGAHGTVAYFDVRRLESNRPRHSHVVQIKVNRTIPAKDHGVNLINKILKSTIATQTYGTAEASKIDQQTRAEQRITFKISDGTDAVLNPIYQSLPPKKLMLKSTLNIDNVVVKNHHDEHDDVDRRSVIMKKTQPGSEKIVEPSLNHRSLQEVRFKATETGFEPKLRHEKSVKLSPQRQHIANFVKKKSVLNEKSQFKKDVVSESENHPKGNEPRESKDLFEWICDLRKFDENAETFIVLPTMDHSRQSKISTKYSYEEDKKDEAQSSYGKQLTNRRSTYKSLDNQDNLISEHKHGTSMFSESHLNEEVNFATPPSLNQKTDNFLAHPMYAEVIYDDGGVERNQRLTNSMSNQSPVSGYIRHVSYAKKMNSMVHPIRKIEREEPSIDINVLYPRPTSATTFYSKTTNNAQSSQHNSTNAINRDSLYSDHHQNVDNNEYNLDNKQFIKNKFPNFMKKHGGCSMQ